jgi:hypothetical protein
MVLTLYGLYSNVCSAICSVLLLLRHGDDIYKMLPRTLVAALADQRNACAVKLLGQPK